MHSVYVHVQKPLRRRRRLASRVHVRAVVLYPCVRAVPLCHRVAAARRPLCRVLPRPRAAPLLPAPGALLAHKAHHHSAPLFLSGRSPSRHIHPAANGGGPQPCGAPTLHIPQCHPIEPLSCSAHAHAAHPGGSSWQTPAASDSRVQGPHHGFLPHLSMPVHATPPTSGPTPGIPCDDDCRICCCCAS